MMNVHATCVVKNGAGLLLRGTSASGKSDLALRLIDRGFSLVADDRVVLAVKDGTLWASPPSNLAGCLEIRGLGIWQLAHESEARLFMVADLVDGSQVVRLPEFAQITLEGVRLAHMTVAPFEASAPIKLAWALEKAAKDRPS